jgi:two-component system OmpR family sensor kinase
MGSFWPSSVRARLTLWYTVLLAVPLVAFAIGSYYIFARTLESRTDAFISDALTAFSRELVAERRALPTLQDAFRATVHEVRFRDLDIVILDDAGRVMAMSAPQGDRPGSFRHPLQTDSGAIFAALRGRDATQPIALTLFHREGSFRVAVRPLLAGQQRFIVAGAYPLREVEDTLERIRGLFLITIPLLIVSAATGGYFLAKRSLAPVASMSARAAEIGASTLHERLPAASQDELGDLARTLNGLLDRLERSFAQQRRFMADASHELRTPTAILRTEADVTLSQAHRTEAEYRESATVVQDAARRLSRIVDDIFLLARADAGHLVMHPAAIDLEDVVQDAIRSVRQIADRRGVRVDMLDVVEAPFHGDADLLGRVLLNLLDNAIKHSPEGGTVDVHMSTTATRYEVAVVDGGPGVPPEDHERVFERFVRLDSVRSRAENSLTSGAGLGLGIARRIAGMHGGTLRIADSRPGHTRFQLSLPKGADGRREA